MNNPREFDRLLADIRETTALALDWGSATTVGGGSINRSYRISAADGKHYFLKLNQAACGEMFEAERDGLQELDKAGAIRVPKPIGCGVSGSDAYLLLEYLELGGGNGRSAARLGTALAQQHRHTQDQFGWYRDNTIGRTPQGNQLTKTWLEFFSQQRLGYQFSLARRNGYGGQLQDRGNYLLEKLPVFLENHQPAASLLHGDLWGGNWGVTANGEAVIFDPAVYYGDRETDIAMTRLFGGFNADFHAAYHSAFPLETGHEQRQDLYNLYHVLNHLNLFGESYLRQSLNLINRLLAAV